MQHSAPIPLALLLLSACPSSPPVSSIDGLEGGSLTSSVSAPSLTADGSVTADAIAANTATIAGTMEASSVTIDTATVGSLVVEQPMTTLDVEDLSGNTASFGLTKTDVLRTDRVVDSTTNIDNPPGFILPGRVVLGRPIGVTTPLPGTTGRGYRQADESCAQAFADPDDPTLPEAHVCTSYEVALMAGRLELQTVDQRALDGAAYNTFTVSQVGTRVEDGGLTITPIIANDCSGWTTTNDNQGFVPQQGFGEVTAIAAKHVLHVVDTFSNGIEYAVFPGTSTQCGFTSTKWLCCQ